MQEVIQEKEIFRGYEVRNWNFTPRIYKILAASAIFNVFAMALFSQTNLLTKKGCDSPFVSTVCQVLDTIYVGKKIFGTDGDYVVKEYNKTELGVDDEVTFINVDNISPPISYPEGYFALANPENFTVDANGNLVPNTGFENVTPGIPADIPNLMNTTPTLPPVNNDPTTGIYPDSPFSIVNDPTRAGNGKKGGKNPTLRNDSPTDLPKLDGDETTEPKVDERTATNSDSVSDVDINKKPFQDLGKFVSAKWSIKPDKADNKIELKPFKVILNAKLKKKLIKDEDGDEREVVAFDQEKSKWAPLTKEEAGDQEMVDIAKQAIEAVGDSGFLAHLFNQDMTDVKITLFQKDDKIFVSVESILRTEQIAKSKASGFGVLLTAAKLAVKGEDEKFLLDRAQLPTTNGRTFILNFEIEKGAAQEMIVRKLAEEAKKEAEKNKQNPNNSTATTFNSNTNTAK